MKKQICVMVSRGHGNDGDCGAVSGKFVEADMTKDVAEAVYKKLLATPDRKFKVYYPELKGDGDSLLEHRQQAANLAKKYRVVSIDIHFNAANKKAKGVEVWVPKSITKRKYENYLAKAILAKLVKLKFDNRGTKYSDEFIFLKNAGISAIVECGFLDNKSDQSRMNTPEKLEKIGNAVAQGILEYVKKYQ